MSYIRPLEGNAGLYIYPQSDGINFCSFPHYSGFVVPDECLDVLLARMDNEEVDERREHGKLLLKALFNQDFDEYKKNKSFYDDFKEVNDGRTRRDN